VAEKRDVTIGGPAGPLTLRLYRGAGTPEGQPLPCLLYLHGGGWVLGSLDSHEGVCCTLANEAACWVVAVDYRLAPEHPFPAAVEDCAAALNWLAGAGIRRSGWTATASPSAATARAGIWPPSSRS
jgi:acetyl esterase